MPFQHNAAIWFSLIWDRIGIGMGLEAFLRHCRVRVEALNHALRSIPEDRVRYHLCWGSWHGPHAYDLELKHLVDILLSVKAQAYLIEAANARHEHEYAVWETVQLARGQDSHSRRDHAFDRCCGTPGAGIAAHSKNRRVARQGECDRRSGLWLRRPHASANRLGQAALPRGRREIGPLRRCGVGSIRCLPAPIICQ